MKTNKASSQLSSAPIQRRDGIFTDGENYYVILDGVETKFEGADSFRASLKSYCLAKGL